MPLHGFNEPISDLLLGVPRCFLSQIALLFLIAYFMWT
ncbi:hypothetical protein HHE03_15450 [Helicobacter heilmannii]|uniref:Uncharacterized protein n=1 Tax=Helicobacter heilmannii TaxID=35817 RepID=A0A0K2YBQ0_HELHE|nr:hypothetical protein BN341_6930 [Helicobacter heilmannii ASB1.4]CRF46168.1 hypothetical protein HHE014_11620 [Helicobacter heilmannii]CRF49867.1 hypothetical protein HHE03_15450 [Helicobacter heilmannii]CRI34400.1 hypothetical protein HHE01_12460 [Helicobacter heilmannii]